MASALRSFSTTLCRVLVRPSPVVGGNRCAHTYDGDGKTTVTILNQESDSGLMINGCSKIGFRLNNGMSVIGPLALFPKSAIGWDVKDASDITPASVSAFVILEPKLDILVIGVGDPGHQVSQDTQKYIRAKGISLEILPTEHACTTFNFLNVERRYVAAALIPPQSPRIRPGQEYLQGRIKQKQREQEDADT